MHTVRFGDTGFEASRLGVGLAEVGFELSLDDQQQASNVLNTALDRGINFLDTAYVYGKSLSEVLICGYQNDHSCKFKLATKGG